MPCIMVVDDDELIRTTVGLALCAAGYRVLEAEDGDLALSLARAERPDLVLLDAVMPRLDGFATLGAMQLDPLLSRTPVIMLTDLRGPADVRRALGFSIAGYIVKPVDMPLLLDRTARALRQSISQAALEWID